MILQKKKMFKDMQMNNNVFKWYIATDPHLPPQQMMQMIFYKRCIPLIFKYERLHLIFQNKIIIQMNVYLLANILK